MPVNKKTSFPIGYVFLAIFSIILVHDFIVATQKLEELPYSEFKTFLAAGNVAEVTVTHQRVTGKLKSEEGVKEPKWFTTVRVEDPDLVKELSARQVTFSGVVESTFLRDLLSWIVPTLVFVGIWFFAIRKFGQGQSGFMTVGQSKATDLAKSMVKSYGMSDKLGTITLDRARQPVMMQLQAPQEKGDYSEETTREIDCEVRRIIDEQYERVKRLLTERKTALLEGAKKLLEQEVITGSDLKAIMDKY